MKKFRLARVAEVVRVVASEAILFHLRDPRIKFTTVTRTEVTPDLQTAKVYVSVMGSEKEQTLTLHGLRNAAGFVQSKLAERMTTRYIPKVQFFLDTGLKNSLEVSNILAQEKLRQSTDDETEKLLDVQPTVEDLPSEADSSPAN